MPVYFVDADGNIVARFVAVSPEVEASKTADGLTLVVSDEEWEPGSATYGSGGFEAVPAPTEAELLSVAKSGALDQLLANINRFIEFKPDGKTRYDTNLKLNMLDWRDEIRGIEAAESATAEQQAWAASAKVLIESVRNWIIAVQAAYLSDRKAAIAAATNQDELDAVSIGYDWFEERYGVEGSVLADPDVYTSNIVNAGSE